ncbi:Protein fam72b [Phlyctochytrium bullatum]|nr:Protein fam72b [Phlyctochytrium bullatum]
MWRTQLEQGQGAMMWWLGLAARTGDAAAVAAAAGGRGRPAAPGTPVADVLALAAEGREGVYRTVGEGGAETSQLQYEEMRAMRMANEAGQGASSTAGTAMSAPTTVPRVDPVPAITVHPAEPTRQPQAPLPIPPRPAAAADLLSPPPLLTPTPAPTTPPHIPSPAPSRPGHAPNAPLRVRAPLPTPTTTAAPPPAASVHPQFRSKTVCKLFCRHCDALVCTRGMKAILLGDTRVELYSTDAVPGEVQMVERDYVTRNCRCRIRDIACLKCGNVIGYHVTQPCDVCLDSCNNGHFWMFLSDGVSSRERISNGDASKKLLWAQLPCVENDFDAEMSYELLCR